MQRLTARSSFRSSAQENEILVGVYIGILVPAFFIVVFRSVTDMVHAFSCILFRSSRGIAWELLQAHGRDYGDRILARPPDEFIRVQEEPRNREENLQKIQQYVESPDCSEKLRN